MRGFITGAAMFVACAAFAVPLHGQKVTGGARPSMTVRVTDKTGKPISYAWVQATGLVVREDSTGDDGRVVFRNMSAGTYRLRFEHEAYITLERDVTMVPGRALSVEVALNATLAGVTGKPQPSSATRGSSSMASSGPVSLSIPDFIEQNLIRREPSKTNSLGCAPEGSASLIQLQEPLAEHVHGDADEMLYVVAGEGRTRIGGQEVALSAGTFAVIPRGLRHDITRRGRNPLFLLSILAGKPCEGTR